jgi:hypothetical protein
MDVNCFITLAPFSVNYESVMYYNTVPRFCFVHESSSWLAFKDYLLTYYYLNSGQGALLQE